MKIFTKNGILNKLILIVVAIIVFNVIIPTNVSYAGTVDDIEKVGGPLIKPVIDMMMAVADICMDLIHNMIYDMETSVIRIDANSGFWEGVAIFVVAVGAAAFIALVSGGLTLGALVLLSKIPMLGVGASIGFAGIASIVTVSVSGGIFAGMMLRSNCFSDEIVMPLYRITPEEIFSGKISFLNVNFFTEAKYEEDELDQILLLRNPTTIYSNNFDESIRDGFSQGYTEEQTIDEINKEMANHGYTGEKISEIKTFVRKWENNGNAYEARLLVKEENIMQAGTNLTTYTRQFNINEGEMGYTKTANLGHQLKPAVAKWYYATRNFALIAMMVILLYIGIRIMFCGISSQKAKYKNMLVDWIVAICLIFIMHYIMVFAMNVADSLINIFGSVNQSQEYCLIYEYDKKIVDALEDAGVDVLANTVVQNGQKYIVWDARNIVGFARVQAALNNSGTFVYIGWVMCYCVLVCYTVFFVFTYLRRAIYLTFLTVIAPLVAMTYPIDKIHDGKAQAFDMWLKEYIFNLMIQPVHLLLYTVLISSAFDLAVTNVLYMLVAIGFMMQAEKLLRKMFGFGKAETPGMLSGAAGTAIMMSSIEKLMPKNKSAKNTMFEMTERNDKDKSKGGSQNGGSQNGGSQNGGGQNGGGQNGGRFRNWARKLGNSGLIDTGDISNQGAKVGEHFSRSIGDGKPIRAIAKTMKKAYFSTAGAVAGTTIALAGDEPGKDMQQKPITLAKLGEQLADR